MMKATFYEQAIVNPNPSHSSKSTISKDYYVNIVNKY